MALRTPFSARKATGTYKGAAAGSFGTGCFSLYATKNITSGEGGMITTNDPVIDEKCRVIRQHGMRVRYYHDELGFNFRMTDVHAAIGLAQLKKLAPFAEDAEFRKEFRAVKRANKARLAEHIARTTGIAVDPASLFDVQVKRIHEYKRQLLNLLHVVTRYQAILANPQADWVPRVVVVAGKAASAYHMAKLVIKLINDVARTVNADPRIGDRLKVVFIPNYSVSLAEVIIPAADLSEQISTAGTEASGTGNMKFALNGALTIGTLDGANVEMREQVGAENFFIFGNTTEEVAQIRARGYQPRAIYEADPRLRAALDAIRDGVFSPEEPGRFQAIHDTLVNWGDHYLLLADYASYVQTQDAVDTLYRDPQAWARRAVLNVAGMGGFSADRTIAEYVERVWSLNSLG